MITTRRRAVPLVATLVAVSGAAGCAGAESYPWPVSSGPLAVDGQGWGRPGGEDLCWVETGAMEGHFGGHWIINRLDSPVIWTGVRTDEHVVGDASLIGQYGQWVPVDQGGNSRGYWDEWPPHQDSSEPEVVPLEFPVTIEPGSALNPLVGFEADATDGPVHLPYLIYDYEVDGDAYQLIDPMGARLEPDEQGCESQPEIREHYDEWQGD